MGAEIQECSRMLNLEASLGLSFQFSPRDSALFTSWPCRERRTDSLGSTQGRDNIRPFLHSARFSGGHTSKEAKTRKKKKTFPTQGDDEDDPSAKPSLEGRR